MGGVPINVVMPPSIEPNASGINTLPTGRPCFSAICIATGINSASAPTLFMNADNSAARVISAKMPNVGPVDVGINRLANAFIAPEICKP